MFSWNVLQFTNISLRLVNKQTNNIESCTLGKKHSNTKEIVTGPTLPATERELSEHVVTISKCEINLNVGTRSLDRKLYKASMS